MASTFFALNGLVGCGHMSGLVARRICPLALMKSDDQNPYQICELQAHVSQQVVFGLRWRPCRSSRFNALAKLQTVICATAPWICLQERQRPYAFANISARKMAPSACLPPLEFCLGVRPSQAVKSRPELNTLGSGMLAAITEAIILPMPGTL